MRASVRLHGELNDFVAPTRRDAAFDVEVGAPRSLKDFLESVGVPHCEIGATTIAGRTAALDVLVRGGETIDARPVDDGLPDDGRFVLDGHLGRLAAYLRAAGFDVAYDRDADDDAIARVAADEDRVVLSRDVGLLKRSVVRHGRFVRATAPELQLLEVVRRFRIASRAAPFTRCVRCNAPLVPATKDDVRDAVPARIHRRFDAFSRCPSCGRTYWRGTHHARLAAVIEAAIAAARSRSSCP